MSYEPIYADIDPETGEEVRPRGKEKRKTASVTDNEGNAAEVASLTALDPKTPLQIALFEVSEAAGFSDTKERGRWRKLEAKAGADEAGRVQEAWLWHCINWGKKRNAGKPKWHKMPYTAVIAYAENTRKEQTWKQENWKRVTKKQTPEEMKALLTQTEEALDVYNLDME
jgi:hypothetical protein